MAGRRRRRHYRGTPAEHRKSAGRASGKLRHTLVMLRKNLADGHCHRAAIRMMQAQEMMGELHAERSWVPRKRRTAGVSGILYKLRQSFTKKCVVP